MKRLKISKPDKKRTIFLTGATGLVGSYLLKILLQHGHKVYCLARSKDNKSAKQRVKDILNFWDKKVYPKYHRNLEVVEGDIAKKNLGLSKKNRDLLKTDTEEIFHSAAVTDINWPLNKIRKVNVGGTKNVLDFALKCKKLKKVNHISTAYVCGNYKGVFSENDLDVGQKFSSTYKQTKFEAEKLVRTYRKNIPIDIYRPAVVIGESKTGKINEFKNIYQFIQLCSLEIFDSFPILNGRVSIVFVDDCAKAIYLISQNSTKNNNTYHIFPGNFVSLEKFIEFSSRFIGFKKPKIISLDDFDLNKFTAVQRAILRKNVLVLNIWVKFQSKLTGNILNKYNFKFRKFNKNTAIKFLHFFTHDKKIYSKFSGI